MPLASDDLRVLQLAEAIADSTWKVVAGWEAFPREAMGQPWVRAADSIGANIAEAFGRYHDGEKLTFLYYARGRLFETKYWLNRAVARQLVDDHSLRRGVSQLSDLARQLNALFATTRQQRTAPAAARAVREPSEPYAVSEDWPQILFTHSELAWLTHQSPI